MNTKDISIEVKINFHFVNGFCAFLFCFVVVVVAAAVSLDSFNVRHPESSNPDSENETESGLIRTRMRRTERGKKEEDTLSFLTNRVARESDIYTI